VSSVERVARAF